MMYALVLELTADGIPIVVTCRVLGFTPQAVHKWKQNPISDRATRPTRIWSTPRMMFTATIRRSATGSSMTSSRPSTGDHGEREPCPAALFGARHHIGSRTQETCRWHAGAGGPDDLVRREFSVDAPNELWFTDITEHPTADGKLYLCAVKDAFSGRIVCYSIDARMKASLAVAALRNAIILRSPADTIVHSDRGSQFGSKKFVRTLRNNGLVVSMGRVGACQDNAAMESFFALPEERTEPSAVADAGAAAARDRALDRTRLPPSSSPTWPGKAHADRVRGRL